MCVLCVECTCPPSLEYIPREREDRSAVRAGGGGGHGVSDGLKEPPRGGAEHGRMEEGSRSQGYRGGGDSSFSLGLCLTSGRPSCALSSSFPPLLEVWKRGHWVRVVVVSGGDKEEALGNARGERGSDQEGGAGSLKERVVVTVSFTRHK